MARRLIRWLLLVSSNIFAPQLSHKSAAVMLFPRNRARPTVVLLSADDSSRIAEPYLTATVSVNGAEDEERRPKPPKTDGQKKPAANTLVKCMNLSDSRSPIYQSSSSSARQRAGTWRKWMRCMGRRELGPGGVAGGFLGGLEVRRGVCRRGWCW